MGNTASPSLRPWACKGLIFQLLLGGVIGLAALTPQPGSAALYVPVFRGGAFETFADKGVTPLAAGPWAETVIVRARSGDAVLRAAMHGALLMRVPDAACSGTAGNPRQKDVQYE